MSLCIKLYDPNILLIVKDALIKSRLVYGKSTANNPHGTVVWYLRGAYPASLREETSS
jgi:hypothetical protein